LDYANQFRPSESLLDLGDFRFHDFANQHKWNKDNEFPDSPDSLATEGNIPDRKFAACAHV
jgi:hypothetical protein